MVDLLKNCKKCTCGYHDYVSRNTDTIRCQKVPSDFCPAEFLLLHVDLTDGLVFVMT